MKKFMIMAAAVMVSLSVNAQSSPEAKAIKKMKSYTEVLEAIKANGASFDKADNAFAYNKLVDLAISENSKTEKAAIEAQLAKNAEQQAQMTNAKNAAAYNALQAAMQCNSFDEKGKYKNKNVNRLMTIRNSMVQAGLDAYNTKDYESATKYFGAFVETRTDALFNEADFSREQNFGQIAYYAALAAYFNKDYAKCDQYADAALNSSERDSIANDVIIVKLGAYEEQAKTAVMDSATYVKNVRAMYDQFPENENIFGKLVGLYEETGDKASAKTLLDARLAANPHDAMANAYVGQTAQGEQKYDEAIAAYSKAVAAKPDFLAAKLNLGVCYLNKAVAAVDANTDARGNINPEVKPQAMSDLNEAKKILEEVRTADPDCMQVNWKYPLERVNYVIENVK
ncbi:MAG: hypothetical protein UHT92_05625 [Prevotella sp.]|jgi:tetratricopeptide (TPR) repeat protein|nr:hypothetical protein [Prevotella sp.]